jgi:hypothetical protein
MLKGTVVDKGEGAYAGAPKETGQSEESGRLRSAALLSNGTFDCILQKCRSEPMDLLGANV